MSYLPTFSAVVPAQAGTHTPQPRDVAPSSQRGEFGGYGSPPARGRQLRDVASAIAGRILFLFMLLAVPAHAQDYPTRPITLVVPYAAGGGNDLLARAVAERMSRGLGQQIVIENRGGAGG